MVELIDDKHVVKAWVHVREVDATERLDGSEDAIALYRFLATDEQLTKPGLAQHGTEDSPTLLQDLLPMGYEEQLQIPE